ncbi:thymidine kinase 2, mitochondrial [Plakobranchus ocellatus]|uniref:Thymidine kinase 2, mitochondrial n=1 Tax=Plakobranchus ocellatus TaxID=259542 RepID=A0AAV4A649_9GAST|nr:thymidine kinase 2, mitochondrial [Plakobranchus ocellatus]
MSRSTSKTVVCVEGNIGCGKTSLLNYFEEFRNCEVLPEPVEKWQDVEGYNALGLMYKDPERWSMALQTYIQLTMLQNHIKLQEQNVRLMERSIYSAKYCFTDNLFESGKMPGIEHVILSKWFDWILRTQNIKVDLFVYLRTDPKLLHKRIMTRCRKEEEGISVDLLMALHEKYEDWFIHKKHPCPAEVLVIDANHSLEEMKLSYETHKNKIMVSQANN